MLKSLFREVLSIIRSRLFILGALFFVLFLILFHRLFVLQIVEGEGYLEQFTYRIKKETQTKAPRGTIYDSKGTVLAYDRLAYSIVIEDSTLLSDNESKNAMIETLITIIEKNGETAVNNMPMIIDENGTVVFNGSDGKIRNFKKDIFSLNYTDSLSKKQEAMTAQQLFDFMRSEDFFNLSPDFSVEEAMKIMAIRYELYMKRYQKYVSVTVVSDVDEKMVASVKENGASLPGVTIEQDYIREYNDSKYYAHITGYTGRISDDQMTQFEGEGHTEYSLSDIVGKTGVESVFEYELSGTKGSQTLYVNSLGSILETTDIVPAVPGNDLYLTIDAELTKSIYNLLEEKIAGIILANLAEVVDEENNENHLIPYTKVFHAFIENNILDTEHFYMEDATELEKSVAKRFDMYLDSVIGGLRTEFEAVPVPPQGSVSEEYNKYYNFIYNWLKSSGFLNGSLYDANESVYKQWENGDIGLGDFLKHAISEGWIDTTLLEISGEYVDSSEVYDALVTALLNGIRDDLSFHKLVYSYVISSEFVTEKEICLLLYDQDVLSKDDDAYTALVSDTMTPRGFVYSKIYNMELTPEMLALDTCAGAVVVTDPNTGQVKALVSYPSYDANRIADPKYYASLLSNESHPLFNRATQQTSAPGSTYKMLAAITGLEEGLITPSTVVTDLITFEKVTPSPSCWNKNGHGNVDVVHAIGVSCNYFFYDLGYNASLTEEGAENDQKGLETLEKYAKLFGFGETTGLEIGEAAPKISDESSVRSFIGQGTNNYTPTQVNRYTAAVANKGTVYSLSLVDRITDSKGSIVQQFTPDVVNNISGTIHDSSWNLVQQGMWLVCNQTASYKDVFSSLNVSVAGKSGTAQESELKPDHAWFTGFAPFDNPQAAVTVLISNGHSSTNVVDTFRDTVSAYFNLPFYDASKNTDAINAPSRHARLPITYGSSNADDSSD